MSAPFPIPPSVPALDLAEGIAHPVRRHRPDRPAHARSHRGLRLPAVAARTGSSSAATRSSPAAGDGPTCLAATSGRWSSRSRAWRHWRTASRSCRAMDRRPASAARSPGSVSWHSTVACPGDGRLTQPVEPAARPSLVASGRLHPPAACATRRTSARPRSRGAGTAPGPRWRSRESTPSCAEVMPRSRKATSVRPMRAEARPRRRQGRRVKMGSVQPRR